MLNALFDEQKHLIETFFCKINISDSEKIFDAFASCKGTLVFSGVGKSGVIAEKLAMTMMSIGTKALYLPPLNALHGDLGCLAKEDLFIIISKSGETEELITLLSHVKQREIKTMAWVCKENSRLSKFCDISIVLPLQKELCPFDLVPTTSTIVQLIFGDILAVALMKTKKFTIREFAKNHPGGMLGKRLNLKVEDVMLTEEKLPICRVEDSLERSLIELTNKQCGCVLVTDEKMRLQGIFTDGDLRRSLQTKKEKTLEQKMRDLMTTKYLFVEKGKPLLEALCLMQKESKNWVKELPVLEKDKLVGLIRMHDIIEKGLI